MNKHIDARTVGSDLEQIMDAAVRDNTRYVIERDGKPSMVLMSVQDFHDTVGMSARLDEMWAHAELRKEPTMTMDEIDAEIALVRREMALAKAQGQ